jgi:Zn-dependent oligopeptidase
LNVCNLFLALVSPIYFFVCSVSVACFRVLFPIDLFSGESYASAYYVYLWAEVLDADGFEAFIEVGDCFSPEVAERVYEFIYSAGNSMDPAELFRKFRGR